MAAKAFAPAGDSCGNGGICAGESPVLNENDALIYSLHSPQGQGSKMVRKRAASEMEFHAAGNGNAARFSRRSAAVNGEYVVVNSPPNPALQIPIQVPNCSTMTMAPPSSNFSILTTSKSGSGSETSSALSSCYTDTAAAASSTFVDSSSSSQSHHVSSTAHSVCVFSGLPLFPPDRNRGATGLPISPSPGGASVGMEDTAAWIDGIIKDLIHGSNNVSIPQLILNVREIIHPCNPNLAELLEYRLCSLTASADDPRRKESLPPPPRFQGSSALQLHLQTDNSGLVLSQGFSDDWPSHTIAGNIHYIQNTNPNAFTPVTAAAFSFPPRLTVFSNPDPAFSHVSPPETAQPGEQQHKSPSTDPTATTTRTTSPSTAPTTMEAIRERKQELQQQKRDEDGLHLLTLLLPCAEAVSADNLEEANKILLEISQLATPFGTSAQRVAAYFSEAMSGRIVSSCLGIYAALPTVPHSQKMASAFQVFMGSAPS